MKFICNALYCFTLRASSVHPFFFHYVIYVICYVLHIDIYMENMKGNSFALYLPYITLIIQYKKYENWISKHIFHNKRETFYKNMLALI